MIEIIENKGNICYIVVKGIFIKIFNIDNKEILL